MQGMALATVVDSNVLSYPMLVFMKEQGAVVERGGACPQTSSEAELALNYRARQDLPSDVGRGGAYPQTSGEAELALSRRARRSLPSDVGRGGASPQQSGEAES